MRYLIDLEARRLLIVEIDADPPDPGDYLCRCGAVHQLGDEPPACTIEEPTEEIWPHPLGDV